MSFRLKKGLSKVEETVKINRHRDIENYLKTVQLESRKVFGV